MNGVVHHLFDGNYGPRLVVPQSRVWCGSLINIAPELDRAVSSTIGSCSMMDRARQISIDTQTWVRSDRVRQWENTDDKTRSIPRYLIGYQLPADTVAWLEDKRAHMQGNIIICADQSRWAIRIRQQNGMILSRRNGSTETNHSMRDPDKWWNNGSHKGKFVSKIAHKHAKFVFNKMRLCVSSAWLFTLELVWTDDTDLETRVDWLGSRHRNNDKSPLNNRYSKYRCGMLGWDTSRIA